MKKFSIQNLILFFLIIHIQLAYSNNLSENISKIKLENKNIVHFIKCGGADSILIETNGKYGLIDSSNPYKYIENEVEHVDIDESIGEVNQWVENPDHSVQAVLNYLDFLKIEKLDFILGTHAHSDHIGGIPAIAYKYVNEKLIDVTNKFYKFNFGDFNLEILNTDIDPDELNLGENQNSIVVLLSYDYKRLLLAADMISKDDKILKDYLGKIDILKLAHHGYSESSYEFLSTVKPDYVVISNYHIPDYVNQIINYLQDNLKTKIYLTEYISGSSQDVENSAIKLIFNENTGYEFSNTGKEVTPNTDFTGWSQWIDKWTYIKNGKMLKGWQELEWSQGKDLFYFNAEGFSVTGWQNLERNGTVHTFYFLPENCTMVANKCIDIDGKNYCFDENGYLISG